MMKVNQQDNTENHDNNINYDLRVSCVLCLCLRLNFVYNYYVIFWGNNIFMILRIIGTLFTLFKN